jgi:hypothetical protein
VSPPRPSDVEGAPSGLTAMGDGWVGLALGGIKPFPGRRVDNAAS